MEPVEDHSSAEEIDKLKLKQSLSKVAIWDYAKILKQVYKNFSKDEQSSLLKIYYSDMLIRLVKKINFSLFSFFFFFDLKKYFLPAFNYDFNFFQKMIMCFASFTK